MLSGSTEASLAVVAAAAAAAAASAFAWGMVKTCPGVSLLASARPLPFASAATVMPCLMAMALWWCVGEGGRGAKRGEAKESG